jgi:hypothetical protein
MRNVTLVALVTVGCLGGGSAFAAPFEAATIPDQVEAVGHLDVDALRKTQFFTALGGEKAIDGAVDEAPADLRPLARSVAGGLRGISFWRDDEHGAVYVETRDGPSLAALLAKTPAQRIGAVGTVVTYVMKDKRGGDHGFAAAVGDTLVLADTAETLERSIRVIAGHAPNLGGSSKLPAVTRTGIFFFVTLGPDALNTIHKSARARVLQLACKSIVIDVGESAGVVTANAHAEMGTPDALQKAKSILDGLRAMASLSTDGPERTLLDAVTITANGLALDVNAKLPVTDIARAIESKK